MLHVSHIKLFQMFRATNCMSWNFWKNSPRILNFLNLSNSCAAGVISTYFLPLSLSLGRRSLYSQESLGLTNFRERLHDIKSHFANPEVFKNRIQSICASNNKIIFSEDLGTLIGLTETEEDLNLLKLAIKKYYANAASVKIEQVKVGPSVMKLLCLLNKPNEALNFFKCEETSLMFQAHSACFLLLNLLFKNKMYEDIVSIYENIAESFSRSSILLNLIFGALYKINTQNSYERALQLWWKAAEIKFKPSFRSTCFFSMLAFNQGKTLTALEVFQPNNKPITINIKALVLAREKRFTEVCQLLQNFLCNSSNLSNSPTITSDTLEFLKKAFTESSDQEKILFDEMVNYINKNSHVTDRTIDAILCEEINLEVKREW